MNLLTSANIGSTVRWVFTTGGAYLATQGILTGFDWVSVGGAVGTVLALTWSYFSNKKKVA